MFAAKVWLSVEPNPFAPRLVLGMESTSSMDTFGAGLKMIWAIALSGSREYVFNELLVTIMLIIPS